MQCTPGVPTHLPRKPGSRRITLLRHCRWVDRSEPSQSFSPAAGKTERSENGSREFAGICRIEKSSCFSSVSERFTRQRDDTEAFHTSCRSITIAMQRTKHIQSFGPCMSFTSDLRLLTVVTAKKVDYCNASPLHRTVSLVIHLAGGGDDRRSPTCSQIIHMLGR